MVCLVFGPFLDFLDLFGPFRVRVGPFSILKVSNHTNSSRRIDPRYPEALGNSFALSFFFESRSLADRSEWLAWFLVRFWTF